MVLAHARSDVMATIPGTICDMIHPDPLSDCSVNWKPSPNKVFSGRSVWEPIKYREVKFDINLSGYPSIFSDIVYCLAHCL